MAWGLEHMSSREFAEWQAFYGLEPFGDDRADVRSAMICKILADLNTPRDQPRNKLEDFMPRYGQREQAPEEMLEVASHLNALFGGLDLREEEE